MGGMETAVLVIAIIFMLVGLAGTVFPFLPGVPLIFMAIAAYGWYEGFDLITSRLLIIFAALTILSLFLNYISAVLGAKHFGSSKAGIWGALVGTVAGVFILPPLGIFIGPWIGAFIGEYLRTHDINLSFKAAVGAVIGLVSGILFDLILGIVMVVTFLIKVF